jgi:hypothetical protein
MPRPAAPRSAAIVRDRRRTVATDEVTALHRELLSWNCAAPTASHSMYLQRLPRIVLLRSGLEQPRRGRPRFRGSEDQRYSLDWRVYARSGQVYLFLIWRNVALDWEGARCRTQRAAEIQHPIQRQLTILHRIPGPETRRGIRREAQRINRIRKMPAFLVVVKCRRGTREADPTHAGCRPTWAVPCALHPKLAWISGPSWWAAGHQAVPGAPSRPAGGSAWRIPDAAPYPLHHKRCVVGRVAGRRVDWVNPG